MVYQVRCMFKLSLVLQPVLDKMKEQFGQSLKQLSREVRDAEKRSADCRERATDRDDELAQMQTRFAKLDHAYKEEAC